jgi:hypothetical protein
MSVYSTQDISISFSGDIEFSANGDVKLADSYESHKNAINFLLKTNKGDFKPDKRVGCDLGNFIGQNNSESIYGEIEDNCSENIGKFIMSKSDFTIHSMPLSHDEAGVFVVVGGTYVDKDGNLLENNGPEVMTYVFPFLDGQPRIVGVQ